MENIMFGDTLLERVLSGPIEVEETRIRELGDLIEELGGPEGTNALDMERTPLKNLLQEKARCTYPELNLEFLSMHNKINHKGFDIQVPKFSVYRYAKDNSFSIEILRGNRSRRDFLTKYCGVVRINDGNLPEIFDEQFLKSLEFSLYSHPIRVMDPYGGRSVDYYCFDNLPKSIRKKYSRIGDINIINKFHGIIPKETKERKEKSTKIFRKKDLFLIKETKPEEWNITSLQRSSRCPLLVGVIYNKCYLIDHFDTTQLEKYVTLEWTK